MARTTTTAVQAVLMSDYDTINNPDLTIFITVATAIVNQVVSMAALKNQYQPINIVVPCTSLQERIECYLAAHFYTISDRQYKSKSTGGASANFAGVDGSDLDASSYGRAAQMADISGCLRNLAKRQIATGLHLGTNRGFWEIPPFPAIGDVTSLPFQGRECNE